MTILPTDTISIADVTYRILLTAVLAGAIGFEREHIHKPAGLRTNILVGIGSALIMVLSLLLAQSGNGSIDPGRIAGQVITGIGFLCAGAIFHERGLVVGLTTAATIWVVAAIGLTIGAGFYLIGVIAAAAVLIVLNVVGRMEHHDHHQKEIHNDDPHA